MAETETLQFALDASLKRMERALARAEAITNKTASNLAGNFRKANAGVTKGLTESATGLSRLGQISGAQRFVLQNTAAQFGDLAVQISGGTSASRAMSQQLPQLFGGFAALGGPLGLIGPLLGAVAAIGLPVAAVLYRMAFGAEAAADKAEVLADQVELLTRSAKDYRAAADAASISTDDLAEKYGRAADRARAALTAYQELERLRNEAALASAATSAATIFGSLDVGDVNAGGGSELEETLRRMREEMGLTGEDAVRLSRALQELGSASGPEAQVAAIGNLRDTLESVFGSLQAANVATDGFVDKLREAELAGLDILATTQDIQESANLIAGAVQGGVTAFQNMRDVAREAAGAIREAASEAYKAAQARVQVEQTLTNFKTIGIYQEYGRTRSLAPKEAPAARAPGRAASRGAQVDKALQEQEREAKRVYDETRTAAEKYAAELERLDRLKAAGAISAETYSRKVGEIRDEFTGAADRMAQFESASRSAFVGFVTGAQSAAEAASNLLSRLADMAANAAFDAIFGNIFSPGSGPNIPKYASGTNYHPGGLAIVGEKGPELINLSRGAQVIPNHDLKPSRGAAGGGGAVDIRVAVDESGGLRAYVERTSGTVAASVVAGYDRRALPTRMQQVSRDPRRRG